MRKENSTLACELEKYHIQVIEAELASRAFTLNKLLHSSIPRLEAELKRRKFIELLAQGFSSEESLTLIGED